MVKQVIFVIEPKRKTDSDGIYLMEIINHYYPVIKNRNNVSINFVAMHGKNNFKHKRVISEINNFLALQAKSKVVYVFDKDKIGITYSDNKFFKDVTKYTLSNKYELIWFVKDIENVLLKRSSNNKTDDAKFFKKNYKIKTVNKKDLSIIEPTINGTSNVLVILDKVFKTSKKQIN